MALLFCTYSILSKPYYFYILAYASKMVYSLEQRIFIVLEFYHLDLSFVATRRSFQRKFNVRNGPANSTIQALFKKFQRTGNVNDDRAGNVGRPSTAVSEVNAAVVQQIIQQRPQASVRRVACHTGLRRMTTHRIMRNSLHLFPYKVQTRQPLSADAINARDMYANAMLLKLDACEIDVGNIWFSDESYFFLDGFVNKQNWRIWGTENPHVAVLSSLHPPKVMVWAAISSRGLIGPFFGHQTITSAKYLGILNEFVAIQNALEDGRKSSWFMQDGARPHRTAAVFDFLNEHFGDRVIALHYEKHTQSGMDWPPYSPDLTPCDFFLWGYLKDQVYRHNPQTVDELEQYISAACQNIPTEMFSRASANFVLRLRHVVAANGGYFENIVL